MRLKKGARTPGSFGMRMTDEDEGMGWHMLRRDDVLPSKLLNRSDVRDMRCETPRALLEQTYTTAVRGRLNVVFRCTAAASEGVGRS